MLPGLRDGLLGSGPPTPVARFPAVPYYVGRLAGWVQCCRKRDPLAHTATLLQGCPVDTMTTPWGSAWIEPLKREHTYIVQEPELASSASEHAQPEQALSRPVGTAEGYGMGEAKR